MKSGDGILFVGVFFWWGGKVKKGLKKAFTALVKLNTAFVFFHFFSFSTGSVFVLTSRADCFTHPFIHLSGKRHCWPMAKHYHPGLKRANRKATARPSVRT